jgi:hypothetical protein
MPLGLNFVHLFGSLDQDFRRNAKAGVEFTDHRQR